MITGHDAERPPKMNYFDWPGNNNRFKCFFKVGLSLKNKTVLVFHSSRRFPMLFRPILKYYVVMQTVHETAMKIVQLWLRLLTENGRPLAVYGCRPIKSV